MGKRKKHEERTNDAKEEKTEKKRQTKFKTDRALVRTSTDTQINVHMSTSAPTHARGEGGGRRKGNYIL